ncbi:MAG: Bax inhibitor-1/YccA family protein [Spirochaetia bacterium]|jgi:FtsH-binding integral membrane protein|nr:Bax inhibitor-1/YccA family protein [Spirochaetia bacterium]
MDYTRGQNFRRAGARDRSIIKNVYLWMTAGLALTGVVAFGISGNQPLMMALVSNSVLFFGIIIAELGLVWYLSARIQKMSTTAATFAFALYAFLNGITLSVIFLAYTGTTISLAFFTTAATFGAMSIYAMTTKRDLSGMGHYLMMGVLGIIVVSIINIFLKSPAVYYMISYIGVLVFMGLTAYDTQKILNWSAQSGSVSEEQYIKFSIMGALKLYLDFINIFLFMLRIFGRRR